MSRQNSSHDLLKGLYRTHRPLFDLLLLAGRASASHIYFLSLGSTYTSGFRDLEVANCQSYETYSTHNLEHQKLLKLLMPKLTHKNSEVVRVVTNAIMYCRDSKTGVVIQALAFIDLPIDGGNPQFNYIRLR